MAFDSLIKNVLPVPHEVCTRYWQEVYEYWDLNGTGDGGVGLEGNRRLKIVLLKIGIGWDCNLLKGWCK